MTDAVIDATRRSSTLAALDATTYDLLVIGGGITGVGAALDASARGLDVALVEAGDLGGGTSSRSSRLLHGGVRYLEQLELGLVREALRERALLSERLAPHLVRRLPFVYPLRHRVWERAYVGAGLGLYDGLARSAGRGDRAFRRHRHLSRRRLAETMPALRAELTAGALEYDDGQVDDARLTVAVARTAAREGAVIATRVRAVAYSTAKDCAHVVARDELSGTEVTIRARQVLAACGVWTDEIQRLAGNRVLRVRASKGVHLVVPHAALPVDRAVITRADRSVLFVIPVGGTVLVGTTDTAYSGDPRAVAPEPDEIAFLLDQLNPWLRRPIVPGDVAGAYAGLRPLVDRAGTPDTARLSREHVVASVDDRCIALAGGKLTTYRVMARDAVDLVVERLGGSRPPSCTHQVPLVGADGFAACWSRRGQLADRYSLPHDTVEGLLRRHGSGVREILDGADPADLLPVAGAGDLLRVEVVHAVRREGALSVEDVLTRRTREGLESVHGAAGAAAEVAAIMARQLDRGDAWATDQAARYRAARLASRDAIDAVVPDRDVARPRRTRRPVPNLIRSESSCV